MKKFVLAAVAAAVAVPAVAAPGDTANTQGEAVAQIVAPINITHTLGRAINFGIIAEDGTGGSITVTSGGTLGGVTGGVSSLSGSTLASDQFTVTGDAGRSFNINTLGGNLGGPGADMAFTTSASAGSGTLAGGTATFTVGGTLTVGANQTAGSYTGQYEATVTYQ